MIECPWCQNNVQIVKGRCEVCHEKLYEVSASDFVDSEFNSVDNAQFQAEESDYDHLDVEDIIKSNYKCAKCKGDECKVKEVAMNGTGLSKILDIQHNHYLFVSCTNCGSVEIYDPDILRGKKSGSLGTILDILFG